MIWLKETEENDVTAKSDAAPASFGSRKDLPKKGKRRVQSLRVVRECYRSPARCSIEIAFDVFSASGGGLRREEGGLGKARRRTFRSEE